MTAASPLQRLQQLLRELFQLDQAADLDFGIYRLFRIKRDEVAAFIDEQLPRTVDEAFGAIAGERRDELEEELADVHRQLQDEFPDSTVLDPDGGVADDVRAVAAQSIQRLVARHDELRAALASMEASDAQQSEIFNHLHAFFSRYYEDGDFVPHRRYGAREHYAIPYNGEETYFHWANRGQHYVKSAEVFKDYAFRVEGDIVAQPRRVRFVLAAASVSPGDTKGEARYFFPKANDIVWDADTGELRLPFEYRRATDNELERHGKRNFQDQVLEATTGELLEAVPDDDLRAALSAAASDEDDAPTLLRRHVRRFVRRITSDYFVHRDLKGFLERELEFYVKDQILHLADLDGDLESRGRTIRVFRRVAQDVITFLAQIEDVQKRLFEKRKFVLRTDYLVLLREVPREWWSEVVGNPEQLEAWQGLFKVGREQVVDGDGSPNEEFLAERPTLVVDTSLFDEEFRDRLLATFDDLDDATGGVLIHSENYQALRLLQPKYAGRVKCIYIDPPYNTVEGSFAYKNNYKHSSWLAMISERVAVSRHLLRDDAVIGVAIDDAETHRLRSAIEPIFGPRNFVTTIAAEVNPAGQNLRPNVPARSHDYLHIYAQDIDQVAVRPRELTDEEKESYPEKDDVGAFYWDNLRRRGGNSRPADRPKQWYPLHAILDPARVALEPFEGSEEVWPIDPKGEDRIWRVQQSTAQREIEAGEISVLEKAGRLEIVKKTRIPEGKKPKTLWNSAKYSATSYGTKLLNDIVQGAAFSYPKSLFLVRDTLNYWADKSSIVVDYFGGSGTTAHATLLLNRVDGGRRKFIIAEMGKYFDTVLVPRMVRVIYSPKWKNGEPKQPANGELGERSPSIVKILRLESYEDALHSTASQASATHATQRSAAHRSAVGDNAYRLRYLVRLPLRSSDTMLSLEKLERPFDYTLETLTDEGPVEHPVDLVETFNLCLGLHVERMDWWESAEDGGRRYRIVIGRDRDERRTLILWRDMDGLDAARERSFLEAKLDEAEPPFERALINGDSGCPRVESLDPLFKRLIEEEERP